MRASWHGVRTVARQELVVRIRAGRWRWLLAAWFLVVSGFTSLAYASARASFPRSAHKGVVVYGALVLFVLGLSLLVVPSLTAQSVNGDRERGTLATLQVTLLTPLEIALGKLAAGWGTAVVFLALAVPSVLASVAMGGVPLGRVLVVTAVVVLLLGVVSAVALCLSALLSRTTTSGVLSYLAVFVLCVGTLVAFGLAATASTQEVTRTVSCLATTAPGAPVPPPPPDCASTYTTTEVRTDRIWWLLAPNPFVIVADAAPSLPPESAAERARRAADEARGVYRPDLRDSDPLGGIGRSVRGLRNGPGRSGRHPVWPYGLAFDVLLASGAIWLTARRLTTPSRSLPRGQRVA